MQDNQIGQGAESLIPLVFMGGMLLIGIASLVFWLWMLIDCIKNESDQGNTKVIWVIVIVLLGILGALVYVVARRPQRIRELGR